MSNLEDKQLQTLIRWMNVELRPSPIHGVGMFAIKDISKGTMLYTNIMPQIFNLPYKKLSNNAPAYIHDMILERWPRVKNGEPFVYPDARYLAYCNHSDNANFDAKKDIALKDISAGVEITEDYKLIEGWEDVYKFLKPSVV